MDLRIPGNLSGNAGDSVGGEMAATGATVGRIGEVFDTIQANFDYNDASALKYQSDLEKQDYHVKFWQGEDGSDPESMKRYNEGLGKIDQNYIDRAYKVNNRVGGYVQKDAAAVSANLTQEAHKVYYSKFLNKSIETDKNETDRATKRAVMTGEFGLELQNNMIRLEGRRPIYGDNVDKEIANANSYMAENFIRGRLANPTTAAEFLKRVQENPEYKQNLYQHLPATKIDEMEKLIAAKTGDHLETTALDAAVKASAKEGYVDYNAAVSLALSPQFIAEHSLTIDQAQNIATSLETLGKAQAQQIIDETNKILVPIALQRNGVNKQTDLSPTQWAKLESVAPEYAAKLQDTIRRENDYAKRMGRVEARERRAEAREIERDRRQKLADNETSIMLDDDFMARNLDSDLATGFISRAEYNRLKKAQKDLNPVNRDSVKEALKQINTGTAIKSALKEKDASQLANWRMKYGELVKTWAVNNANEPNFDVKLQEFMEKHVLSPLVTDMFMSRKEEREQKYSAARIATGQIVTPRQNAKTYSQEDLEYTAKKHGLTVEQVKQKLGVK